ncbi:MAG: T9SS type A sorting domain-containing protein, partial [Bacteroidetes bacterium]|nr:T9SS type A sorting domain-containing protein [Bacteroidota bacterium]
PANTVYYRLKCLDIDGKFTYSTVKKIEMSSAGNGINIYPNPAKNYINIELLNALTTKEIVDIAVYNATGNKIFQSSTYTQKINTSKWAKGVYTIAIKTTQQTISKKIIVE